ncbi:MAG: AAA domain-containing protein [Planctomycetota bacterium]
MASNGVLSTMLDRLYASLMSGPSLNCRPHSSRQRIDASSLAALSGAGPDSLLADVLGPAGKARFPGEVPRVELERDEQASPDPQRVAAARAWDRQVKLLRKLRYLSEDARTYEQDTGVSALYVGYPILALPPGLLTGTGRRIVAPIAMVPVALDVSTGSRPAVTFAARGSGVDLVAENTALLAWIERETGKAPEGLFVDESGEDPRREIVELIRHVVAALDMSSVDAERFAAFDGVSFEPVPKAEDLPNEAVLLSSAVVGLFPSSNQGLIRDTREMIDDDTLQGPVRSFISADNAFDTTKDGDDKQAALPVDGVSGRIEGERNVARADPCQAATVAAARTSPALVIHGPPGTGKSQTITNIIGDHLARGERVLFVCDKRTALDVVANRLEHLGLGDFCAVVHDPQRDQRDLYMAIRGRLEALESAKSSSRAEGRLEKIDAELAKLHDELTAKHAMLMAPDASGASLHALIGRWLAIGAPPDEVAESLGGLGGLGLDAFEQRRGDLELLLNRATAIDYPTNAWARCAGVGLEPFLGMPVGPLRQKLATCMEEARVVDGTIDDRIPTFGIDEPIDPQLARRERASALLSEVDVAEDTRVVERVWALDAGDAKSLLERLSHHADDRLALTPLDTELKLALGDAIPGLAKVNEGIVDLDRYLASTKSWLGFLAFSAKAAARRALRHYGLTPTPEHAERVAAFLRGLKTRLILSALLNDLDGTPGSTIHDDTTLLKELARHERHLELRTIASEDPRLAEPIRAATADAPQLASFQAGLAQSQPRGRAILAVDNACASLGLINDDGLRAISAGMRKGQRVEPFMTRLHDGFAHLEEVLRIGQSLVELPAGLNAATDACLGAGLSTEDALATLERAIIAGEIDRRIDTAGGAGAFDGRRLDEDLKKYGDLELAKHEETAKAVRHRWLERQRQRLLVGTGSRLNSLGARVRQRLYVRGARAMRLRQVIALGAESDYEDGQGDPIFDLCPIWMASPETVAQVFPREALFDTVIFDEASQCRLEEALPVLTRARRVVIAGDPKQLPPTRFFESGLVSSDDEPIDSDESMFEAVLGEVEDLLQAALNVGVDEAYLDVHYRSRNADLIEFSNRQFYRSRLQAIPGHPSNRAKHAPVTLIDADGVYDKRCNPVEAERVCDLIDELLSKPEPPSIGVACFSISQRDTILDALANRCDADSGFGKRVAAARQRWGEGSFEGLFVKNLESVQGDERDHIIISTTYGPNPEGKFYRRFGPLGRAGGGRRLNVLVTRARQRVHLVTSIPSTAYAHPDPIPEGMSPNGSWLLFAYLRYAANLAAAYEEAGEEANTGDGGHVDDSPGLATMRYLAIEPVSPLAVALGRELATSAGIGSDVHWGNRGFCIDAALHHPIRADDATLGLLCDFNRFEAAADPVTWEVFRSGILAWQGWALRRVWSPQLYRDSRGVVETIASDARATTEAG